MRKKHCFADLYRFELKKILKNKVAVVSFIIFFLFSFIQGVFEVRGNIDPAVLDKYDTINGRAVDEELMNELLAVTDEVGNVSEEGEAYTDLRDMVKKIIGAGASFNDLTIDRVYRDRLTSITEGYEDARLTEGEIAYWQEREAEIEKPFVFHDSVVMSGVFHGITNYAMIMLFIIAVSLSSIFAYETQRRTDAMIRSTINGIKELYFAKVLAGMTYVMISLVLYVASFLICIGATWGFRGMDMSIISYLPFTQMDMTGWQLAGILITVLFLGTMLVSAFALFVSNLSRNSIATMAIVTGVYLGMFAASTVIPMKMRFLSQTLSLLPSTFISERLVYEYRLIGSGGYLRAYQVAPVLYIGLTLVLIFSGYLLYKKYEIKNN